MAYNVTAKIRRSLKTAVIVGLIGGGAMFVARPFIALVEPPPPLDSTPITFADYESELRGTSEYGISDSILDERTRQPVERVVKVGSGDTVKDMLIRVGVDAGEAGQAAASLGEVFDPRSLRVGQDLTVSFSIPADGLGDGQFTEMTLNPDPSRTITVRRDARNAFVANESKRQLSREVTHYSGSIRVSLFDSAMAVGVPTPIIGSMIKALSYDVDFQRDVQAGDAFDVMFEGYYDPKGKLIRSGEMIYAAVTIAGHPIAMYRYEDSEGTVEFFNERGESLKKALLRTPVDGARITSGFGMRLHPVLGYTKMHKGVDFGVPYGTPIMAAGDGTVEMAGFNGSYGNYIRIRHGNGFATAYAHMSRIAQGIYIGKHVTQAQVIGYVGATGRATGPHLHYEVLNGNTQVNPNSLKIPTGIKLSGKDMEHFRDHKQRVEALLFKLAPAEHMAGNPLAKPGSLPN